MADQRLYSQDVADHLGIAAATWRRYCCESSTRRRQAPPADGTDIERGHARPWWWKSTIVKWNKDRPGAGSRTDLGRNQPNTPLPPGSTGGAGGAAFV